MNPLLQKYYIRILWMVPIYAIESWLALRFRGQKLFLETAREAYEAYVIYNFYMLLLHYLGGGKAVRDILKAKSDAGDKFVHLIFPFCCLKWKRSGQFINRCTVGVFQYVIIRFFLAFVTCLVESMHNNHKGNEVALERTVVAIIVIINVSQIWAMYCLVAFYHEFSYELRAINPFWKFVVVKTVVFLSFWQGLLISGMAEEGMIKSYMDYPKDDVASGIQDFLICVEMAAISVAHKYVFSYRDMEIIVSKSMGNMLSLFLSPRFHRLITHGPSLSCSSQTTTHPPNDRTRRHAAPRALDGLDRHSALGRDERLPRANLQRLWPGPQDAEEERGPAITGQQPHEHGAGRLAAPRLPGRGRRGEWAGVALKWILYM